MATKYYVNRYRYNRIWDSSNQHRVHKKKVEFCKNSAFVELQGETDRIEVKLEVWEKAEDLLDDLGVLKYVD